jgi:ankyrin repeat protein
MSAFTVRSLAQQLGIRLRPSGLRDEDRRAITTLLAACTGDDAIVELFGYQRADIDEVRRTFN